MIRSCHAGRADERLVHRRAGIDQQLRHLEAVGHFIPVDNHALEQAAASPGGGRRQREILAEQRPEPLQIARLHGSDGGMKLGVHQRSFRGPLCRWAGEAM